MTTKNDITGDALVSKETTDAYREGYDRIFGKGKLAGLSAELEVLNDRARQIHAEISQELRNHLTDSGKTE